MQQVEFTVVRKYWEVIDEFVTLRIFPEKEVEKLLQNTTIPNKNAFLQLVINTCVVNYNESILPNWISKFPSCRRSQVEESLYQLCIQANPHLDIRKVTLPAEPREELHLIEKGAEPQEAVPSMAPDLNRLEKAICRRIVGQEEAVHTIFQALRKASVGLKDMSRPIGAFLFIGKTGVGKTEMAKALVKGIFRNPSRFIRIDCQEYALPHEYAKLIGSPPGYVGFDQGGALTERGSCREPCVLLFDEIEKAHQKVHHLLLHLMDEGFVTDAKGRRIDFSNALILLTSNMGTVEIEDLQRRIGFKGKKAGGPSPEEMRGVIIEVLKKAFVAEFLNRLDEIVLFRSLRLSDCARIVDISLKELFRNLRNIGRSLNVSPKVREFLAREGFNEEYGAREIKRVIRQYIENPLAERILEGRFPRGFCLQAILRRNQVHFASRRELAV